jgi:hypothetical protein
MFGIGVIFKLLFITQENEQRFLGNKIATQDKLYCFILCIAI